MQINSLEGRAFNVVLMGRVSITISYLKERSDANLVVTGRTRREVCRSMCKLLLKDMVKNTGRVEQMANRYIEGKADGYSRLD